MRVLSVSLALLTLCALTGCQTTEPAAKGPQTVLLINCGATKDYVAPDGRTWSADQPYKPDQWGFTGGMSVVRPERDIAGTDADPVYLAERYDLMSYRIPLPNGSYTVKLHFAETFELIQSPGERMFNVEIEGQPALTKFDPVAAAGKPMTAVVKTVPVDVTDGELTIKFIYNIQSPMINGIEILQ